jgi:hypothetical protein
MRQQAQPKGEKQCCGDRGDETCVMFGDLRSRPNRREGEAP